MAFVYTLPEMVRGKDPDVARDDRRMRATAGHVDFTQEGSHVLFSVWTDRWALVNYDAHMLAEVKRVPMRRPIGRINVHTRLATAGC
ncbi:MAG: cytochrome D1 domain-containing protein [Geminicoccaceae bacterium]